ncbi:hypothetical protein ULF88_02470 [Halopseudomonas pachastrellae]|nr:hypothetical protein [Halopseudomonas pachastrellae]
MVSQTNELALEIAIEQALTGMTTEAYKQATELKESPTGQLVANNGFELGLPSDFNAQYALDEKQFWRFLERPRQRSWVSCKSKPLRLESQGH